MREVADSNLLQVLACEIDKRPIAPGIDDLAPLVRVVRRTADAIAIEFPLDALATVEAFAAAERQCCAGIGWQVEAGSAVTLRITTNEAALDTITQMFATKDIEGSR